MPPDFVSHILLALLPLFLVAAGQAVVMTGGGIDLTAPAATGAALLAGSWVFAATAGSVAAAAIAMPAAGLALGMLQGIGVARSPLPAWAVSLGALGVLDGLSSGRAAAGAWSPVHRAMTALADPLAAWVGLAVVAGLALHLAMKHLVAGPWLRAVGCHREAARAAGVPVAAVTVGAYALSGLTAGLAAVFLAVQAARLPLAGGSPVPAWWLVDVLGAAALAGAHRPGGRASPVRVLAGAVVMVALTVLLAAAGAPPGVATAAKSLVVLGVLAVLVRSDHHP